MHTYTHVCAYVSGGCLGQCLIFASCLILRFASRSALTFVCGVLWWDPLTHHGRPDHAQAEKCAPRISSAVRERIPGQFYFFFLLCRLTVCIFFDSVRFLQEALSAEHDSGKTHKAHVIVYTPVVNAITQIHREWMYIACVFPKQVGGFRGQCIGVRINKERRLYSGRFRLD